MKIHLLPRKSGVAGSLIGLTALLTPSLTSCDSGEKKEETKPNIVVIIADDLGWNDIGYHGSEIKTPVVDRLSQNGMQLDKFYVCSVSSPSRASLLTGRFPSRFGILSPLGDPPAFPAGTPTLASVLRQGGYDTGISGKWHLGTVQEARPLNYGFNSSYGYLRGQIDPYTHLYKNGDKTWHRNDTLFDEEGHATDLITQEAIRFINVERDENTPFFLYVAYSVPHYPLAEPDEWVNMYSSSIENESRRNFAASVSHMDNSIGLIMKALEQKGLASNTLVMFVSDNGGQQSWSSETEYNGKFKPNDVLGNNRPLRDWKGSLYDGAIRVPAIMYWPGKLEPKIVDYPLSIADVLPTFAEVADAPLPEDVDFDGVSFWSLTKGAEALPSRSLYWRSPNAIALQKGEWKLVHRGRTPDKGDDELYNIAEDPYETSNVAEDNAAIVSELKEELIRQSTKDQVNQPIFF